MHRIFCCLIVFAALICGGTASHAVTGIVLMHGKWGTPLPRSPIGGLVRALENAGFRVVAPEMPWSRNRLYDRDLDGTLREIDAAVATLRRRGADKIVVGGHSMGANLALAYGTRRNGLAGILMIAPGHRPELRGWAQRNGTVARQARAALARGQGSRRFTVSDYNQGGFREFTLPAQVAVDFFAPDGPTVMPLNAPRLRRGTALMWIIGEGDRLAALGRGYVFDAVPPNPKNLYVVVSGGHRATPRIGQREIVAWLRGL